MASYSPQSLSTAPTCPTLFRFGWQIFDLMPCQQHIQVLHQIHDSRPFTSWLQIFSAFSSFVCCCCQRFSSFLAAALATTWSFISKDEDVVVSNVHAVDCLEVLALPTHYSKPLLLGCCVQHTYLLLHHLLLFQHCLQQLSIVFTHCEHQK